MFFINMLRMIGVIFVLMVIGGTCGFLLETAPGALFRKREDMLFPGLILTVVFTLILTFLTPLGKLVFSVLGEGNGAAFVIFGGPMPLPVTGAVIGFIFLGLLGAAAAVVFLCLLDILAGALRRRR